VCHIDRVGLIGVSHRWGGFNTCGDPVGGHEVEAKKRVPQLRGRISGFKRWSW
jgi:hypothetical protein